MQICQSNYLKNKIKKILFHARKNKKNLTSQLARRKCCRTPLLPTSQIYWETCLPNKNIYKYVNSICKIYETNKKIKKI